MKTILSLIYLSAAAYLLFMGLLYLLQRNLLFYSVPSPVDISSETMTFDNQGIKLQGWILNGGQPRALIYFGGNAEVITNNIFQFESLFKDYTVYLVNYRGYGNSEGKPTEAALFSDSLAIYDKIRQQHSSISLFGRSLGSGIAVYLATKRRVDQLILLTPYDSVTAVAQTHYPVFPVRYLVKDRFDSVKYAPEITTPVLIVTAESDRVVPKKHAEILRDRLTNANVTYRVIAGAAHNNVTDFSGYREAIEAFIKDAS